MAGRYVLSLIAAALIGGILTGLFPGGTGGKLLKLLCGVFLLTAVLQPLGTLQLPDMDRWLAALDEEAQAAAETGTDYLRAQKRQVLLERLEAYILDKASELGMDLTVELTLDREGCPEAAADLEDIVQTALSEAQIESLIIAKGYADCVAYMTNDGISVAVSAPEGGLQQQDVAVIADVVMSQSGFGLESIRVVEVA